MKPDNYPQQPSHIWEHFYQFTQIPRPSKHEQAVRQYVIDQAEALGHRWQCDAVGNLVVYVPATPGMESSGTVIIQNHLDMVTVKTEDKQHDFFRDPLSLAISDGWLHADRSTLGADNGVGCAAALALMTDDSVAHPPLELLFTIDEETGLVGASELDASMLSGERMLNLDTEDWNELYIGCTGGGGWSFTRTFKTELPASNLSYFSLSLKGLAGGHSGIQIHQQLGSAIKLLVDFLQSIEQVQLVHFKAGVAHNVIPREGEVIFACPSSEAEHLPEILDKLIQQWLGYLPAADHGLSAALETADPAAGLSVEDSTLLLDLLAAFPHGAQSYNLEQPADLVDLSINLACVELSEGQLELESSLRFFNAEQAIPLRRSVESLARLAGLQVEPKAGYPGWQPDFGSPLLAKAKALHQRLFGIEPAVKAIHAGLECGILKSKKPDVDILSFGPTIRAAHSPSERLEIATVAPFWQLLTALLAEM
ncbi:beta-Ala-His dipeptidase [Parahaliea sp. F7430]|uniref:Cytosol non-specific dipeptidase n=1 Tax=Sediminihaliea albiluteola TaxID=2758564 RepID=A0A7W2TYM9_9GAMM|nr:beta-Ala-His dipeptidase [Sediminihaliea albiluteola]MBA6414357.1 beta-Ala-His dipeptidase [Sediminihaliea albiluteola]